MDLNHETFHQRLTKACKQKNSYLCVGIDPRPEYLPVKWQNKGATPETLAQSYLEFSCMIIDRIHHKIPIIKPQSAFFEALGYHGVRVLEELSAYAQEKGLLVIGDLKRGDIGSTAAAYAQAAFKLNSNHKPLFDAVTVNPYMGLDGVQPFIAQAKKTNSAIFVLCKTSNPSSQDLQDLKTHDDQPIYSRIADLIHEWSNNQEGLVGAVVGATHPKQLPELRNRMPLAWLLIPGVGAQGGTYEDAANGFRKNNGMALVSASRSITFPWLSSTPSAPDNWLEQIEMAVDSANHQLNHALDN